MQLEFTGEMRLGKGTAPWHFVSVPDDEAGLLEDASRFVPYGWGMIPVSATIGGTDWETSLWPKESRSIVPIRPGCARPSRSSSAMSLR